MIFYFTKFYVGHLIVQWVKKKNQETFGYNYKILDKNVGVHIFINDLH